MMTLNARFRPRKDRSSSKIRHRMPLEVAPLEGRVLLSGAGDTTAPVTQVAFSGNLGGDSTYTTPVTLTFTPTDPDDASNTLTTYYSVNGGQTQTGNSVTLTGDGTYSVYYWSVDPAGNNETTEHQLIHVDQTPPTITADAQPNILWPPNHKIIPVTVTGQAGDNQSGINRTLTYQVIDEYHQFEPSGTATVDAQGNYHFDVGLLSSRLGQDRDGRQYVIKVTAHDLAGNAASTTTSVVVPHDMGNGFRGGFGGPGVEVPGGPSFAEIRRERLAARQQALAARRAEAAAAREQRLELRHEQLLQRRLALQARQHAIQVNQGQAQKAARQALLIQHGQAHPRFTIPAVAQNHGNGNGNAFGHANVDHGNQGNHGNGNAFGHGNNGHGHGKG